MKRFNVKVNGIAYQVEVEEVTAHTPATVPAGRPVPLLPQSPPLSAVPAIIPAPVQAAMPAASAAVQVGEGETAVAAPMPGKVTKILADVGKQVQRGEVLMILEAMKMQNEIPAAVAGVIKAIHAVPGQGVKPGEILAVIGQ